MWNRKDLKARAKAAVKRNYWKAVLVGIIDGLFVRGASAAARNSSEVQQAQDTFLTDGMSASAVLAFLTAFLVFLVVVMLVGMFLNSLLVGPLRVGTSRFKLSALQGTGTLSELSNGFRTNYMNNVKANFFVNLYTSLWSLLFIIPGIVKAYEYRLVPYILADNPDMDSKAVLTKSKEMMDGNKWNTFVLDLSFILWDALDSITFGLVGLFFVQPYKSLTEAALYEALKAD